MKQLTFRLKSGQYLNEEIKREVEKHDIQAGVLLSIVGGLENAVLRMPSPTSENQIIKEWNEPFEIVAGTGTISKNGSHIHLALSNQEGIVIGGHLKDGCKVRLTAEIVIGIFDNLLYSRKLDQNTSFKELEIE